MSDQQRERAKGRHAPGIERKEPLGDLMGGMCFVGCRLAGYELCKAAFLGSIKMLSETLMELVQQSAALRHRKGPIATLAKSLDRIRQLVVVPSSIAEDDAPDDAKPAFEEKIPAQFTRRNGRTKIVSISHGSEQGSRTVVSSKISHPSGGVRENFRTRGREPEPLRCQDADLKNSGTIQLVHTVEGMSCRANIVVSFDGLAKVTTVIIQAQARTLMLYRLRPVCIGYPPDAAGSFSRRRCLCLPTTAT